MAQADMVVCTLRLKDFSLTEEMIDLLDIFCSLGMLSTISDFAKDIREFHIKTIF